MVVARFEVEIFKAANAMSAADVSRIAPNHLRVIDAAPEVVDDAGSIIALGLEPFAVVGTMILAVVVPFALGVPVIRGPTRVPACPMGEPDSSPGVLG